MNREEKIELLKNKVSYLHSKMETLVKQTRLTREKIHKINSEISSLIYGVKIGSKVLSLDGRDFIVTKIMPRTEHITWPIVIGQMVMRNGTLSKKQTTLTLWKLK